jgi:hypothetical protein
MYGPAENREVVAMSDDKDKLIELYKNNLLPLGERHRDEGGMYRSFVKGIFYNYNPPMSEDVYEYLKDGWGTIDEIEQAKSKFYFV